eukprot:7321364-Pyramimonas_sp.AAC.1
MRLDGGPDLLQVDVADALLTSPVHRRYIGNAFVMRRDPSTPPTRTPSRRPPELQTGRVVSEDSEGLGTSG